ncbi:hypothetical protein [Balneicella halophila]|nr:hypothetical protein [Balneicella halophila]
MKTTKSIIILAAFLIMAAVVVDLYFLLDVDTPNKYVGAYIGIAAIATLFIPLVLIPRTEQKIRRLKQKIEEKDQEIGRLQKSLEQSNEVINIVPNKGNDVEM